MDGKTKCAKRPLSLFVTLASLYAYTEPEVIRMLYILETTFFWFFAILGFVGLMHRIIQAIFGKLEKKKRFCVLMTVQNEEKEIEGMLRSVVWSYLNQKNGCILPEIIVIDLDSTDGTYEILQRLSEEYPFIHPITKQEYSHYLNSLVEK